ncbi:hypothetical protein JOC34_002966 [Virgibacillus halotolerans]|uniref:PDZ domain-containing protein n=1 Tax=Virgibacillus halotolerans TaxID=1071053 RepID=UPI00195F6986|nr:PDZ domain-containing protein [Virgibacillus halotolerans]MBM7600555.1 hypothetical protein [Virgibacillus halotolerans]
MTEAWLIEIVKAIGKMFMNPLLYWMFLLLFLAGYKRIKQERMDFGFKVFDVFTEWKRTWVLSLVSGIVLSLLIIGTGVVFFYETMLLLCIIAILLSFTLKFTMLSAGYTIGITYLLLIFLPFLLENQSYVATDLFSQTNFTGLSLLLGLFLVIEAILLRTIKRNASLPSVIIGNRGLPIGQHRIKRLGFIPFFALVPAGMITPFAPFWPYFSIGETSYSLIVVPFIIGVDYLIRGSLPRLAAARLAKMTAYLAVVVLLIAIGSIFVSWLSLAAVLVAIIGKEWIRYDHKVKDRQGLAYFHPLNEGLKVLSVIPGSPADRLEILVGETISKVNGKKVNSADAFYLALRESGATFKLDILDDANEVRFLQSALYEGDHYELGLVFITEPYRRK